MADPVATAVETEVRGGRGVLVTDQRLYEVIREMETAIASLEPLHRRSGKGGPLVNLSAHPTAQAPSGQANGGLSTIEENLWT